ncbi:MAG: hypothetical protein LHV68_09520 [Elusimicrobia bacterium]|nr:hypothetical protein [Candidatus Liberimonas magnetica]
MRRLVAMVLACVFALQVYGLSYAMDCGEGCKHCQKKVEKSMDKHLAKMTKELSLTPEQKEKVGAILKEKSDKIKAEMQKMCDAKKAIKDESYQKIKEVLTPEQVQKFDEMKQKREEKMKKKMKKCEEDKSKDAVVK